MQEGAAEGGGSGGEHSGPARQAGHPIQPRGHACSRPSTSGMILNSQVNYVVKYPKMIRVVSQARRNLS